MSSSILTIPSLGTAMYESGINTTLPSGKGDINVIRLDEGLYGGRN